MSGPCSHVAAVGGIAVSAVSCQRNVEWRPVLSAGGQAGAIAAGPPLFPLLGLPTVLDT